MKQDQHAVATRREGEAVTRLLDTAVDTDEGAPTRRDAPYPISPADVRHLEDLPIIRRDHYQILREYARGGIGRIVMARDLRLDRVVAIKELNDDTCFMRMRFAREVRITARLRHPNIVPLHEAGRWSDGRPFFAMKLVGGGSLEEAIDSCVTRQDRMRLLRNVADVADAIAYAHSEGIVHRDLKPANVLVGPFGETVVIDWGLAKNLHEPRLTPSVDSRALALADPSQTTDGTVMGTPPYMPPEQADGRPAGEQADVYSLGAILYQVLCGRHPYFEPSDQDTLSKLIAGPPTPLAKLDPALPHDLVAIVERAMARDPADRYPGARELARDIERFLAGRRVIAHRYSKAEIARRFLARQRTAVATAAVGLALVTTLGAWSMASVPPTHGCTHDQRANASPSVSEGCRASCAV